MARSASRPTLSSVVPPDRLRSLIEFTAERDFNEGRGPQILAVLSDEDRWYVDAYRRAQTRTPRTPTVAPIAGEARASGENASGEPNRERPLVRWARLIFLGPRDQEDVDFLVRCEFDPPCAKHQALLDKFKPREPLAARRKG
jgi:hypothetical protein